MDPRARKLATTSPFAGGMDSDEPFSKKNFTSSFRGRQALNPYKDGFSSHNRINPRVWTAPQQHNRRFQPIEMAKRNLITAYFHPYRFPIGQIFYHQQRKRNKDNSFRKRNSIIRETLTTRVGQILLHYGNLEHMALGMVNARTKKFENWGVRFIANKAKCSDWQARKALKLFEEYGYLCVSEQKELLPNGLYKSMNALIRISPKLYFDLDVTEEELEAYRFKKNKKLEQEITQEQTLQYKKNQLEYKRSQKAIKKTLREVDENPGSERKRSAPVVYRDYTGISANKSGNAVSSTLLRPQEPSPARDFLRFISSIKPPS